MKKYIYSFAAAALALSSLTSCLEEVDPMGYSGFVTNDQASKAPGAFDNFVNSISSSMSGQFTYDAKNMYPYD